MYLPLVERVMEQAQQSGFGLKTLSSVYVGSFSLCGQTVGVSPCGVAVFTEAALQMIVSAVLLRSAFRPASVDIPAWIVADYYPLVQNCAEDVLACRCRIW